MKVNEAEYLQEHNRMAECLASSATWNTETTRRHAKEFLERGVYFCNGELRRVVVKSLGLGVYHLSSKRAT